MQFCFKNENEQQLKMIFVELPQLYVRSTHSLNNFYSKNVFSVSSMGGMQKTKRKNHKSCPAKVIGKS